MVLSVRAETGLLPLTENLKQKMLPIQGKSATEQEDSLAKLAEKAAQTRRPN
jgi:hypothetical protein